MSEDVEEGREKRRAEMGTDEWADSRRKMERD